MDQPDDGSQAGSFESIYHGGPGSLGGEAATPDLVAEKVGHLILVGFGQLFQAIPADHTAVIFKGDSPVAITPLLPVLELVVDIALCFIQRESGRRKIFQDIGFLQDMEELVGIFQRPGAQDQVRGRESGDFHTASNK